MSLSSSSKTANLADRMKVLLSTGDGADIHFLLFRAHKHILKLVSNVFEAMFRYDDQNVKNEAPSAEQSKAVEIPDVEPQAFKVMLSFSYADDLSELSGDNAMAVLYAANKYNISALVDKCLQIPIKNLSNVFMAYVLAHRLDLEDFARQCLRYICQNTGELFRSEEFLQIHQNLLCELFDRDQLMINDEFELWKAALRWADEKCRQNAIECSAENRRAALGPALFKIRFPLMLPVAFVNEIVPSGILTNDEFVGVYQFNFCPTFRGVPGLYPLKFPIQTRISDWNIAKGNRGTIAMEIEKFSEFARGEEGQMQLSDAVGINGFQWKIFAGISTKEQSMEKCLGFGLWCTTVSEKSAKWSCKCSATFRIVSLKIGTENPVGKIYDCVFNNEETSIGFGNFITFTELMDPCKGYAKYEDKVTLAVDIFAEEENEKKFDSDPNKSNGTIVMEIDKFSEFAQEIVGSERSSETVFVKGIPFKISVQTDSDERNEKSLIFALECCPQKDPNWRCKCSATARILSQKSGTDDFTQKFEEKRIFSAKKWHGFGTFITFANLMDQSLALYDKDKDKVTLAIDFTVEKKLTKRKLIDE
ncbi:hypothetical protein niasHT_037239 [Heterodera trifolii]|uniref:BTB domain-containing protein n=1 Tax=Heterodera trifolii TaxID=157864 RepID=A0ABD2IN70_9BILA